jgi:ribose/xylose/arabinose/galactoside ABC-type transport system permease subunit
MKTKTESLATLFRTYGMLFVLLLLIGALGIAEHRALSVANAVNLARQISITALIASGQTLVILSGNIDLSVGAVLGLAGVVSAGVLRDTGSPVLALLAGVAVGAVFGFINGVIVAKGKVASFIVTLATLGIASGFTLIYTGARPIPVENETFLLLGQGKIGGVPIPILLVLATYFVLWLVLTRTRFGCYTYAIGGNELATRLSGIPVSRYKILIFTVGGCLAGLTGVVLVSRLGSGVPTLGSGFELIAITAVVLGGTSLFGGEGHIWGTLVGAAITGVISNGLNLLNVGPYYHDIVTGVVVLLAILSDRWLRSKAA